MYNAAIVCVCVCVCGKRQARCVAFVCMLETVWLIQIGNCVGIIHFKNSLWRHVNVCKHCIMTAIVVGVLVCEIKLHSFNILITKRQY